MMNTFVMILRWMYLNLEIFHTNLFSFQESFKLKIRLVLVQDDHLGGKIGTQSEL